MLKQVILAALVALPLPALAHVNCGGETYSGAIVEVSVNTVGTMGGVTGGEVKITEKDGAKRGYAIPKEDIPQFFESVDGEPERALVGLAAYIDADYPVQIRYVGVNYQSDDLTAVLRDPARKKQAGNMMRVWKGPGFEGGAQYSFKDVVCTVWLDP